MHCGRPGLERGSLVGGMLIRDGLEWSHRADLDEGHLLDEAHSLGECPFG